MNVYQLRQNGTVDITINKYRKIKITYLHCSIYVQHAKQQVTENKKDKHACTLHNRLNRTFTVF